VVTDPAAIRERLLAAGARAGFRGLMSDARYDRNGELTGRDEVLRLRMFRHEDGVLETILGWKGPTTRTADGYKSRIELEYELHAKSHPAEALLSALGYQRVQVIDRYVEYFHLGTTDLRLEWYPRMDVLLEVEGDGPGIEAGLVAAGVSRASCSPDTLSAFAARYGARTGRPAVLARHELGDEPPGWAAR
jgi:adenylate cyclase class IV